MLDLEPTWAISQIPVGGLESPFFPLDAGISEDTLLRMDMPEEMLYQQVAETFKVFAVHKGLADFRWLTLPELDKISSVKAAERERDFSDFLAQEATRCMGEPEEINPLNELLKMIGADSDQPPVVTRSATVVTNPKHDWVTKQLALTIRR